MRAVTVSVRQSGLMTAVPCSASECCPARQTTSLGAESASQRSIVGARARACGSAWHRSALATAAPLSAAGGAWSHTPPSARNGSVVWRVRRAQPCSGMCWRSQQCAAARYRVPQCLAARYRRQPYYCMHQCSAVRCCVHPCCVVHCRLQQCVAVCYRTHRMHRCSVACHVMARARHSSSIQRQLASPQWRERPSRARQHQRQLASLQWREQPSRAWQPHFQLASLQRREQLSRA